MQEYNGYVNREPIPEPPRSWRDYAAPLAALLLAILFWAVFSLETVLDAFPGLGILVFVLAYWAAVFLVLGARRDTGGVCLMAVSVCLALCCTLYRYEGFAILNCFAILLTAAMATFRFSGQAASAPLSLESLPETVQLSMFALFSRIAPPLRRLRPEKADKDKTVRVLLTVAVTVVLLAVVLALLASADMVFGSYFAGIRQRLESLSVGDWIWRVLRAVGLAVFISSGLYFIRTEPAQARKPRPEREAHALPFLLPTVALDIAYVLFCAVQLRYLFGGAEAAAMAGGWAEYARTGFFQLVAVAAINLTLCAAGAAEKLFAAQGGPVLRIAQAVMLVLTVVILLSAARRMQLYILAYGMSILRLATLWGMIVAAAGILAAGYKLWRPGFRLFPVLFGFVLASWCILCLVNPAGQVAKYNVNVWLDGQLGTVDMDYIYSLTPDAAKALARLEESSDRYDEDARRVRKNWTENYQSDAWYAWHPAW